MLLITSDVLQMRCAAAEIERAAFRFQLYIL